MPRANVVYWYCIADMPLEGGGLRAIAWHDALTRALTLHRSIQSKTKLDCLNTEAAVHLPYWSSTRSAAKRHFTEALARLVDLVKRMSSKN